MIRRLKGSARRRFDSAGVVLRLELLVDLVAAGRASLGTRTSGSSCMGLGKACERAASLGEPSIARTSQSSLRSQLKE